MTLLKIARMGHPVLRQKAAPAAGLPAAELRLLAEDMVDTMLDARGVGLAAPQIHLPLRIIVFRVPGGRAEDGPAIAPTVLIDPEITPIDDDRVLGWEGCLSIPGLRGVVPRYRRIRVRGITPDGEPVDSEATGFHARVIQHEVDHLDGTLFLDRMPDLRLLSFEDEMRYFDLDLPS